MKTTTRESEVWLRSAARYARNNEPVAAALSQHLAQIAQETRDEFEEIRQIAEAMHKAAQLAK